MSASYTFSLESLFYIRKRFYIYVLWVRCQQFNRYKPSGL